MIILLQVLNSSPAFKIYFNAFSAYTILFLPNAFYANFKPICLEYVDFPQSL